MIMTTFYTYILPFTLIILVFMLKSFHVRLKEQNLDLEYQVFLIDEYQDAVARFIKQTDSKNYLSVYNTLEWLGHEMVNDCNLIEEFLSKSAQYEPSDTNGIDLDELSEEAKKSLSRALGSALFLSTFQSRKNGPEYRKALTLAFIQRKEADTETHIPETVEVKEPAQKVNRHPKEVSPSIINFTALRRFFEVLGSHQLNDAKSAAWN